MRLQIRPRIRRDAFAIEADIFLAVIARRRLGEHDAIRRIFRDAEAVIVSLYRAIRRERTRRINAALLRAVRVDIQLPIHRILRRGAFRDVREDDARVRLVELLPRLATAAIRHLREREQIALVSRVHEDFRAHADGM